MMILSDTVFYTDNPERLSQPFSTDDCIHAVCLCGSCVIHQGDRTFLWKTGELAVIPRPDIVSGYEFSEDFRMECVVAPGSFVNRQFSGNHYGVGGFITLFLNPVIPLLPEETERLHEDFDRVRRRLRDSGMLFYAEMLGSVVQTMVCDIFEAHARRDKGREVSGQRSDILNRLLVMLEGKEVKTHRSVGYYAEALNVSPKYLGNLVYRHTGRSVSHLIHRHVMPLIMDAMKNNRLSLSQIAEDFNFTSLSYFSRYVSKHLGMSPSRYRASLQPDAGEPETSGGE